MMLENKHNLSLPAKYAFSAALLASVSSEQVEVATNSMNSRSKRDRSLVRLELARRAMSVVPRATTR